MSNEQPHDPTVTLRLELGRVTDQRDAFKAALSAEVLKVVRVAIIQATIDADNEIARLKAEVDALKLGSLLTAVDVLQFIKLKAEVERLNDAIIAGAITPDAKEVQS